VLDDIEVLSNYERLSIRRGFPKSYLPIEGVQ